MNLISVNSFWLSTSSAPSARPSSACPSQFSRDHAREVTRPSSAPSVRSSQCRQRKPIALVNSDFSVNPSSSGDLHHSYENRMAKRAQSTANHVPRKHKNEPQWIIQSGKWTLLEQKPVVSLDEQIRCFQEAQERELLKRRYTNKIANPGYMRKYLKRNFSGGFFEPVLREEPRR
eukprot:gnl/MRDRNA2_/MRDRNA2_122386_c0_seq1.p1 gnl/MRDRNA2_/MRDRNA2_122386_c0~~gnl/MRDRNA2_/MRDRNA2_122386_c0_seq1.p1  ORF type:complete len:175 (+),score=12.58 gnl/MRDRNA2_/MRDRNA2_122386_c0_seq1:86-610(+)